MKQGNDFINVRKFSFLLEKIVILIPSLVLIGWLFDITLLKSILPNLVPMNPTTAVLFILGGIALILLREDQPEQKIKTGKYIGLFIVFVSLLRIAAFDKNMDFGIDQILFGNQLNGNRMAPNTTFNFFLAGLSLFLIDNRKTKFFPSQIISFIALIISLLAIIGYLYAARSLYCFSVYIPMAIHTAFTFLFLTFGILLSRFRHGFVGVILNKSIGGVIVRKMLPIAICVPIIVGWLRLEGQKLNLFDQEFGSALAVIINISIFSILMWWNAKSLNRADKKRKIAELKVFRAMQIAKDARKAQEMFLSTMSHEIRTPMNGIMGMIQLVGDTKLDVEQKDYFDTIKISAANLLVIINDILDINKISAGKMTFEEADFNLKDLINNTIKTIKYKADEKGIKLNSDIDEAIHPIVAGDAGRLNQILLNLISNAIKFTEKGEVKVVAKKIAENIESITIEFSVIDTGIGIEADKIDSVFESFVQANNSITRIYGGTGLGLTITKRLIDLQKGKIKVVSEYGRGSAFILELPFKKGNINDINPVAVSDISNKELEGIKILVAEDNLINQKVVSLTLAKWGVEVDIADNGSIAIKMLHSKHYDLVLMDVQMPQMDGFEATEFIRTQLKDPINKIPIIAITASALLPERENCLKSGMNDYISKPFDPQDLYEKIHRWTRK